VPEENFWTLWCKGRLTEADTSTIWLGATPSGLSSAHLYHPRLFSYDKCEVTKCKVENKEAMMIVKSVKNAIKSKIIIKAL